MANLPQARTRKRSIKKKGDVSVKTITYTIMDELGLHARPAGKLSKMAAGFSGSIQIGTPQNMVDCKRIMGIMGLGLKQGDKFSMTLDGEDEESFSESILQYLKENL